MAALLIYLLIFLSGPTNGLKIENVTVGVSAKGMSSAAFFKIVNSSQTADTLYGVEAGFAEMAQLHETFRKDGMVGMRPVRFIVIKPKSTFYFKHGGYHVMLMDIKQDLKPGAKVILRLLFKRAGTLTVEAAVKH